MTREEWTKIIGFLQATWPQRELGNATIEAWYLSVANLDVEDALDAARALADDGREFCPNGGQILQRAIALRDDTVPSWSAGWRLAAQCPISWLYDAELAWEWVRERDPVAAEVVRRWGTASWGRGSESPEEVQRAQWRQMYEDVAEERRRGLTLDGRPAIESAGGPKLMGEVIRRQLPEADDADPDHPT